MRYVVRARVKPGREKALWQAIRQGTLGRGSIAGSEYLRNMEAARSLDDGRIKWVEVCFCPVPLQEERPYWEAYFELERVRDAHDRKQCRDLNGTEPFACESCDCTETLERRLEGHGEAFLERLRREVPEDASGRP